MRSRPSTSTSFGFTGSAATARASAHSEARRILSRSMRQGGAKATATSAVAQILMCSFSRVCGIELLEIVEAARNASGVENDRRSNHRAGERPPARFVASGDRPHAALERGALAAKGRTDVIFCQRQSRRGTRTTDRYFAIGCFATHDAMVPATPAKSIES